MAVSASPGTTFGATYGATRKRKTRNAIRLFIGYESDAEVLVKKFGHMKKENSFQSAVDLFSWLLELGDKTAKPVRSKKSSKVAIGLGQQMTELNNDENQKVHSKHQRRKETSPLAKNVSRRSRKQSNPLKANHAVAAVDADSILPNNDVDMDVSDNDYKGDNDYKKSIVVSSDTSDASDASDTDISLTSSNLWDGPDVHTECSRQKLIQPVAVITHSNKAIEKRFQQNINLSNREETNFQAYSSKLVEQIRHEDIRHGPVCYFSVIKSQ